MREECTRAARHLAVLLMAGGLLAASPCPRASAGPALGAVGSTPPAQGIDCQPHWVPTFGPQPGVDGPYPSWVNVYATTILDESSGPALYVGGEFEMAGGELSFNIARWDGQSWSPLGAGMDHPVHALTVFDDGAGPAVYAGGWFQNAGGIPASAVAKWDGAAWSALGGGINGTVNALVVHDDGSGPCLYAGGDFLVASGTVANRIARWNGSSWAGVGSGFPFPTYFSIRALQVFDDGSGAGPALYAAGSGSSGGSATLSRWDGVAWTPVGLAPSGNTDSFSALSVFDDGGGAGPALYATGSFQDIGGVAASNIARWDGTAWSALGSGLNNAGRCLAPFDPGNGGGRRLYVGGYFTIAGGVATRRAAIWEGGQWHALDGVNTSLTELAVFDDGGGHALYAGGSFTRADDRFAKWNGDRWISVGSQVNESVTALLGVDGATHLGPALYAGGNFTAAGSGIARWDGVQWSSLGDGLEPDPYGWRVAVYAMTLFDDGSGPALYAGGEFGEAGGVVANGIAKWSGSAWSRLHSGVASAYGWDRAPVLSLAIFDDGAGPALYAGGDFDLAGGIAASNVAKWSGSGWSPLGLGVDQVVYALVVFDAGSGPALYAGGAFSNAGGTPASGLAKWDGSGWSRLPAVPAGTCSSLCVFDDGTGEALYASVVLPWPATSSEVGKWDGSQWTPMGAGVTQYVWDMAVYDDGGGAALYGAGLLDVVGPHGLAKWDGAAWSILGGGTTARCSVVETFDDHLGSGPALFAGGSFTRAYDSRDAYIAKWGCPRPRPPSTYCRGKTSSVGCVPFIRAYGRPSPTEAQPFRVIGEDLVPNEPGILLYSFKRGNLDFHAGKLCMRFPIHRLLPPKPAAPTGSSPCRGVLQHDFNATIRQGTDPLLTTGRQVFTQWYQRDSAGDLFRDTLTNGLRFTIVP